MNGHDFWLRIRALVLRRRVDHELQEELDFHVEMQIRKNQARGANSEDARREALMKFGNAGKFAEECRDERRVNLIDNLLQDARYATRTMRRSPGFTCIAVLTLALGIGANAAIFSLVDAVLLRPLPFQDPDRLVMVWEDQSQYGFPNGTPAPANFADWKAQNLVFEKMAALDARDFNISGEGEPERVSGVRVTAEFFPLLGVQPLAGRFLLPEDDRPEATPTVVLSYGLWLQRFGGDPQLIGRTISLNGAQHTVIGVAAPGFQFPSREVQLWTPAAFTPVQLGNRDSHYLMVIARMKHGISLSHAREQMNAIARRLEEQYPVANKGLSGVTITTLREQYSGSVRAALNLLLATVGVVLLVACANVAHLLLARGATRIREISVRSTLGASRARVIRQMLTESLLLAAAGGVVGVILAIATFPFLAHLLPNTFPEATRLHLDATVLAFVCAIALLTAAVFGLGPAVQASRLDLNEGLKKAGGRGGHTMNPRLRGALVIAEVSLTVILLVAAGLFVQSYSKVRTVNPGFQAEGLLSAETALSEGEYADAAKRTRFYEQVLERVGALPDVLSASYVSHLPLTFRGGSVGFSIEGKPANPNLLSAQMGYNRVVGPSYFRAMGIPLVRGRHFDERDGPDGSPAVIINDKLARTFFPNEDPLGKRIKFGFGPLGPNQKMYTIVGVVGDVKQTALDAPAKSDLYFSFRQSLPFGPFGWPRHLIIRTTGNPLRLTPDVRRAVLAVDPNQPVANVRTMEEILDADVSDRHLQMTLLSAFSVLALTLAAVGLYGVLCYTVARRTSEIGLRMALGAQRGDVIGGIVRHALGLTTLGIALGLIGAFTVTRLFRSFLFDVSPTDPGTFAAVALLLLLVAAAASYLPARRASTVDPVLALKQE
jgi:predicted permease